MNEAIAGKVVAITGGARGIGAATAKQLISEGATVVIGDREHDVAEKTAADLGATAIPLDVADAASFDAFLDTIVEQFGRIDVLVNNAGFMVVGRVDEVPIERQLSQLDVNVAGVVLGSLAASKRMRAGSQIVNIASLAGRVPLPGIAVYAGTKAAVIAFSEAFDAELRDRDIRVSAVLPAFTNTSLIDGTEATGLMKPIQPEDVADAVAGVIRSRAVRRTAPRRFAPTGAQWASIPARTKPWLRASFDLDTIFTNPDREKRSEYDARTGG